MRREGRRDKSIITCADLTQHFFFFSAESTNKPFVFNLHITIAQEPKYQYIRPKLERRRSQNVDADGEEELLFECDVAADEECSRKLKVCDTT